jgi:hypothetical protein
LKGSTPWGDAEAMSGPGRQHGRGPVVPHGGSTYPPVCSHGRLLFTCATGRRGHCAGRPVDLSRAENDSYVVAGIADHICPWASCYSSVHLLGGRTRFVLSTSGHIAALVNPAG